MIECLKEEGCYQGKIEEINNAIESVRANFIDEKLIEIDRVLKVIRSNNNKDKMNEIEIREIFKVTHNLKGTGETFGFKFVTDIANICCEILDRNVTLSNEAIGIVSFCLYLSKIVLENNITGDGGIIGRQILQELLLSVSEM